MLARTVICALRSRGFLAYLAGGCVRDLLLGREPADYDVATSAPPDEILRVFPAADLAGAHFGVVLVRESGAEVEVATFRSDHSYTDGRHPARVKFETDPRQDVLRRDFTINGLLMDPDTGEVLDYVDGGRDLGARLIRAIGEPGRRFAEDHLRMLRAVRFASCFGFEIEPATFRAIRDLHASIRQISAERVRDEFTRILCGGGARRGFELLDAAGLLEDVLPEVARMKGVEQPPEFHPEGDVWTHTLMLLELLERPAPSLAWAALLHDVGKPPAFSIRGRIRFDRHAAVGAEMAAAILGRLHASNELTGRVRALVAEHLRFKDVKRMRPSTLKRFLRSDHFEEHLELHRLDCLASHRLLGNYEFVKKKIEEIPSEDLRPEPLLNGDQLIAAGFRPGPCFGRILRVVEDAQLEGSVRTAHEALALVLDLFVPPDGQPKQACK
ncbi:MAG: CCA tRNA nucleotidyltransferase [Acidobacteriales bacterium]|nr:CCA tRNA nucleotidyltransferase [Terriglobales bacterium]